MARIAFFTESLPPNTDHIGKFSYDLMKLLSEQGHEIQIYTTYRPGESLPSIPSRISIIQPFQTWSWFEFPKVVPSLMLFKPEVLHFIQPHREAKASFLPILPLLSQLNQLPFSKTLFATTLYDVNQFGLSKNRMLLENSDLVTVSSTQQKSQVEHWFKEKPKTPIIDMLPIHLFPNSAEQGSLTSSASENLQLQLLETYSNFIYIPGTLSEHEDLFGLFRMLEQILISKPHFGVILGGGWGNIPLRIRNKVMDQIQKRGLGSQIALTGTLTSSAEAKFLQKASLVLLYSLKSESLSFYNVLRNALQFSHRLGLSPQQIEYHRIDCENSNFYFKVENKSESVVTNVLQILDLPSDNVSGEGRRLDYLGTVTMDHPANILTRLYLDASDRKMMD